ncbi:hypothetical protein U9M48_012213 [Paspalum notatum var. saurae]|uniref:DUF659 domain-containing protein n=1 Tax=Paspalum notatum var. saurae TaxID=547442 RepID=A0AAQ3SXU2_PASNO
MFTRSQSHVPERVRDYYFGLSSAPVQQWIDTGPWTVKGRTSRELIGRAWTKACHAIGIPGRKVDDPCFKAAIMETQKQGVGIKIPTGREIDGKYLDENVKEIEKEIEKWKMEWDECDKVQDHQFLLKEIKAVVLKVGYKNVVQVVTDNGSNYKKACELLVEEYPHIAW